MLVKIFRFTLRFSRSTFRISFDIMDEPEVPRKKKLLSAQEVRELRCQCENDDRTLEEYPGLKVRKKALIC